MMSTWGRSQTWPDQAFGSHSQFPEVQKKRKVFSDTGNVNAFSKIQRVDQLEDTTRPAPQQIHGKKREEEEDPHRRLRFKRDISQRQRVALVWILIWIQVLKSTERCERKWGRDSVSVDESYFWERPCYTDVLPSAAPFLWDWME